MEALQEIERIDELLAVCRESWMDASKTKKSNWMEKINVILDKRILAMAERDAASAHPVSAPFSNSPDIYNGWN